VRQQADVVVRLHPATFPLETEAGQPGNGLRWLRHQGGLALLQPGLTRASLHDYRLGHIRDALLAAHLNTVFSALALKALAVYAIPTPWLHQDTTTLALYGAYADEPQSSRAPQPAYGPSKDGRDDLQQVLLSLGVSGDGGLPLRGGVRDGNRSARVETPVAIAECLALGLDGVRGIVADSKASSRWTLGLCLARQIGLVTLVPRTCAVRQDLEAWGCQQPALPLLVEKPGRTQDEAPRRWHGHSVLRRVEVEDSEGRVALEAWRCVVVHSSPLAQQQTHTYTNAQAKQPQPWPPTCSMSTRDGVRARRMPQRRLRSMSTGDRGGAAASPRAGGIMRYTIVSWPTPAPRDGRGGDGLLRRTHPR
jgi:hypothetical protein